MRKKNTDTEYSEVCALCEFSKTMTLDELTLCNRKNAAAIVSPEDSCRHFSLDPLKLAPMPKKRYEPEL